jgi:hypothetical protein
MRLAWFSASGATRRGDAAIDPSNDTGLLIRALMARHTIEVIDEPRAHDFVWQHARNPFDLCVFELGGTRAQDFIAPYAVHYPGLVMLRGVPRHDRALQASRMVVVPYEPVAQALSDDYPGVRVRTLAPGVEPLPDAAPPVIAALSWPPDGAALTYAMAGFAAGRAVIVFDGPETADWPSLDPQNWEPRGLAHMVPGLNRTGTETWHPRGQTPICVSIDPRDEAHSLRLALRRLDGDSALRARLGSAAHTWWREHATVERAARGFEVLLEEARDAPDPIGLKADDGSTLAHTILGEFGIGPRALDLGSA